MKACLFFSLLFLYLTTAAQKMQEINPLLHDESFIVAFGTAPDQTTNDKLRIQTHLSYAEQLLRNVPVTHLAPTLQEKRTRILDLLHQYLQAGKFPENRVYTDERRPCFIDEEGTICAVGYLIEQTKGRELAESINAKHQYDLLTDMKEAVIEDWANEFGLTVEECAMIQPTYGYTQIDADIKTGYGVSSGVTAGASLAFTIAQISNHAKAGRGLAYAGMISGTTQIVLGALNIKKTGESYGLGSARVSYKNQNHLSYANIAMGTATLITSALNFAKARSNKDTRNAFSLYSYPGYNNSLTTGISFSRRI